MLPGTESERAERDETLRDRSAHAMFGFIATMDLLTADGCALEPASVIVTGNEPLFATVNRYLNTRPEQPGYG